MSYLAIDPGISTGWAQLTRLGMLLACGRGEKFPKCERAIIELPQVYRASASRARPEDLITLAIRVGQYKERLEVRGVNVQLVQPATWKGQVKKGVHHPRILTSLAPADIPALEAGLRGLSEKQAEDVWDAIGLAKWAWAHGKFR